ncbi:hypothetical protein GW17_00018097 [Ensete ventricosum]|nr:hypothetical protein GW17_00018097 [Ensete ventricosum]
MQWDLVGSSLGDSLKGSGSSLGARLEITGRRPVDLPQECRSLPYWRKLSLSLSLCQVRSPVCARSPPWSSDVTTRSRPQVGSSVRGRCVPLAKRPGRADGARPSPSA